MIVEEEQRKKEQKQRKRKTFRFGKNFFDLIKMLVSSEFVLCFPSQSWVWSGRGESLWIRSERWFLGWLKGEIEILDERVIDGWKVSEGIEVAPANEWLWADDTDGMLHWRIRVENS